MVALPRPTLSLYQCHASGLMGSPTEPITRKDERSWFLTCSSPNLRSNLMACQSTPITVSSPADSQIQQHECTHSRCRIKLRNLMLIHKIPIPTRIRINRRTLKERSRRSQSQRSINDIRMSGDPTHVRHACEFIFRMDVEDVFDGEEGGEDVATAAVDYAFGFTGGAGCLWCCAQQTQKLISHTFPYLPNTPPPPPHSHKE